MYFLPVYDFPLAVVIKSDIFDDVATFIDEVLIFLYFPIRSWSYNFASIW